MRTPIAKQYAVGRSKPLTIESAVNLYPEQAPQDAKSRVVMHGTPGFDTFATFTEGPAQAGVNWLGTPYVLSGGHLYSIDSSGVATDLGDTGIVGEAHMDFSDDQLIICDGGFGFLDGYFVYGGSVSTGYVYTTAGGLSEITDPQFASFGAGSFFISANGDGTDIDGLDFASAEARPDDITMLFIDHREVYIFGANTVEVWFNSGDATFPIERIQGAVVEKYGCTAPESVEAFDNQVAYLDVFGVVRLLSRGGVPQRISTHAIEYEINQSTKADDAYAFVYVEEGHEFYSLTLPDRGTFVFDGATKIWHKRQSPNKTVWRGKFYLEAHGKRLVGDPLDGRLWAMSLDDYDEDGEELIAQATFPPIQADGQRFTVHEYELDFEVGVGLTTGQGSNPQVMLEISEDGRTWKTLEPWRDLGKKGKYKQRVIWRRLGQYRNFYTRASISDPVKRALYAAYPVIEVDGR